MLTKLPAVGDRLRYHTGEHCTVLEVKDNRIVWARYDNGLTTFHR